MKYFRLPGSLAVIRIIVVQIKRGDGHFLFDVFEFRVAENIIQLFFKMLVGIFGADGFAKVADIVPDAVVKYFPALVFVKFSDIVRRLSAGQAQGQNAARGFQVFYPGPHHCFSPSWWTAVFRSGLAQQDQS
jgi:hypothetical protein